MHRQWRQRLKPRQGQEGFTLVLSIGIGLVMVLLVTTLITKAQKDQVIALSRSRTSNSLSVAEGGMARALAELTKPNNSGLLTRNFDPINPNTGKTYFGPDGVLKSGDEESTTVNSWATVPSGGGCTTGSGSPSISYSGMIGTAGEYILKAYRYNPLTKTGTFLVDGKQAKAIAHLVVTTTISANTDNFPGVIAVEKMELYGRSISGNNGNVYYDPVFSANPSLTGSAAPGDLARPDFLNAIKSGTNDGFTSDNVSGRINGCKLDPASSLPNATPAGATDLGDITGNLTLTGGVGGANYQAKKIDITGTTEINADTTAGPVYLYVNGLITVKGDAKITNLRTDGALPRVGDLRIIISTTDQTQIYENACINTAFFYSPQGNLQFGGGGDGCPSPGNSNLDGVVWVREFTNTNTSSLYPGVAVPANVSSLSDAIAGLNLPTKSRLTGVLNWQQVQL
jgi:hypothetical protein